MTAQLIAFPRRPPADQSDSEFRALCRLLMLALLRRAERGLVSAEHVQALADAMDAMLEPRAINGGMK